MPIYLAHAADSELAPHAENEIIQQPPPPPPPEEAPASSYGLPVAIGLAAAIITYLIMARKGASQPVKDAE